MMINDDVAVAVARKQRRPYRVMISERNKPAKDQHKQLLLPTKKAKNNKATTPRHHCHEDERFVVVVVTFAASSAAVERTSAR